MLKLYIFAGKAGPFAYISVTPPYTAVDYGVLMDQLSKSPLVGEDTFIVSCDPIHSRNATVCGYLFIILSPYSYAEIFMNEC